MQNVDFPSLSLSTSFRFNESLAKLAVEILGTKRHLLSPKAMAKPTSAVVLKSVGRHDYGGYEYQY